MKSYYILVHFDGPYVSGFFVPQAKNEEHARKQLKAILTARKINLIKNNKIDRGGELDLEHTKSFLKSVSKPWRKTKRGDPVCDIKEWNLPLHIGFWGTDCVTGKQVCNL